jgi:hypothetical protein
MADLQVLSAARAAARRRRRLHRQPAARVHVRLGGLLLFPMSVGASTLLIETAVARRLLDADREHGAR